MDFTGLMNTAIAAFISMFTGDSSAIINNVANGIAGVSPADLTSSLFTDVYSWVSALLIVFIMFALLAHLIKVIARSGDEDGGVAGFVGGFKAATIALVMPGLAVVAVWVSQVLSFGLLGWFSSPTEWAGKFSGNFDAGSALLNLLLGVLSWGASAIINIEVWVLQKLLPIALIALLISLFSFVRRDGTLGRFGKIALSFALTAVSLKPILILVLGFGSSIVASSDTGVAEPFVALGILIVAVVAPYLVFKVTDKKVESWAKNRSEVYGDVNARREPDNSRLKVEGETSVNQRVQNMNQNGGGRDQTTRNIVREHAGNAVNGIATAGRGVKADLLLNAATKMKAAMPPQVKAVVTGASIARRFMNNRRGGTS